MHYERHFCIGSPRLVPPKGSSGGEGLGAAGFAGSLPNELVLASPGDRDQSGACHASRSAPHSVACADGRK